MSLERNAARVGEAWEAHAQRLFHSVLAWSGDPDVAADAVAEAFVQALRRGEAVEDVGRWVWRAAFRVAGGLLAQRSRAVTPSENQPEPVDAGTLPDEVVSLLDVLGRLDERDRMIVVLSLVGGWSSGDIAALDGSTPGAVRVRLHRARTRLMQMLENSDA